MLKRVATAGALVLVVAAGLYLFAGWRIVLDGSGMWPRIGVAPDFDALEAERAKQHASRPETPAPERRAALATEQPASPATPAASPSLAAPPPTAVAPPPMSESSWPDFRGPNRDGRYTGTAIRTDWPTTGLPRLWKQRIGLGYASFVTSGPLAFTIEQRREREVVAAYEIETGREVWTNSWAGEFTESMGGDGPRATPTYHAGRVYALGALGELRSLDAQSGAVIWRRNILTDGDTANLSWGMAGAPLVVDDKIIVLPGGRDHSVVAYDLATGAPRWHVLDDAQAYVSPMLATLAGIRQIVVVSASRAFGLVPEDGRLLWEYPWPTDMGINAAQPLLLGNDRVFLSAGYGHGAAVFEITKSGEQLTTKTVWQNMRMKNKFTSSLLLGGYIYGLDEAILACLDAATGDLKWKGGRYGYGQVMLAGDHLIVLTESGEVVLVKATPERHIELARFPAIEGKTWNHPVVVNSRLLVRNMQEMAAFDIRPN
jgi:outer membrane protein assembly factor BamB